MKIKQKKLFVLSEKKQLKMAIQMRDYSSKKKKSMMMIQRRVQRFFCIKSYVGLNDY